MTTTALQRPAPQGRADRLRTWKRAGNALGATSAAAVTVLWASGGGIGQLAQQPADALTSLGRLTGLVAADLLLVQVLLMARIPALERAYGRDGLVRQHRLVGFWSFNLLVVHVVLITVGYAMTAKAGVPGELWLLVRTYPGMLLATAGTLALVGVTVTSVRRARRRLRYESWHLIHLYAYLGVGFTVPHQIWTGADFRSSVPVRVFWWTGYGVTAAAVLAFRVLLPLRRTVRHQLTVAAVRREASDVVTVRMTGRLLGSLPASAGQFFVFRFRHGPGWTRGHPFSLSAPVGPDGLQITAKDLGRGSRRLADLVPGTRVLLEGPYGRLTGEHCTRERFVMLACGIGITPMVALLEGLEYEPGGATLVYRARSQDDLVLRERLERIASERGADVHYVLGARRTDGASWRSATDRAGSDSEALLRLVPDLAERDVFVCGPDLWIDAAVDACRAAGLPASQLHSERFSW